MQVVAGVGLSVVGEKVGQSDKLPPESLSGTGFLVGFLVGFKVGFRVGFAVGSTVGACVVGEGVGLCVGVLVGLAVLPMPFSMHSPSFSHGYRH